MESIEKIDSLTKNYAVHVFHFHSQIWKEDATVIPMSITYQPFLMSVFNIHKYEFFEVAIHQTLSLLTYSLYV